MALSLDFYHRYKRRTTLSYFADLFINFLPPPHSAHLKYHLRWKWKMMSGAVEGWSAEWSALSQSTSPKFNCPSWDGTIQISELKLITWSLLRAKQITLLLIFVMCNLLPLQYYEAYLMQRLAGLQTCVFGWQGRSFVFLRAIEALRALD